MLSSSIVKSWNGSKIPEVAEPISIAPTKLPVVNLPIMIV